MAKYVTLSRSIFRCSRVCGARIVVRAFSDSKTDFGFRDIPKEEKESLVHDIFSRVASKYDIMNDFMSMGTHRLWKDELINMIGFSTAARLDGNESIPRHLDVAGGTGDIAFRSVREISKHYPITPKQLDDFDDLPDAERPVVISDINGDMLRVGKNKARTELHEKSKMVGFVEANAEKLPFADDSFDIYTIAFGLRNVTNKDNALSEAYRVLKPGGRILILEFSHVSQPMLKFAYDQYSYNIIPKIGQCVANDEDSYRYLVESIRRFPKQEELVGMMRTAGFKAANFINLSFGVVAIHSGYKIK